jgi:23S rRNA (uracil1939-C5)-methyltransferase
MVDTETNFELEIEKLVYGGEGLGRADGRVVLVPNVLPGERVRVEPFSQKGGLLRAKVAEVLTPSEGRVEPACPYFGRCGGCQYQHAAYELQLEVKRSILRETLLRVGKIEAPAEIEVISGEPWGYRNRSQFHVGARGIGYLEAQSHRLCPITRCPISSPRVNETLAALNEMMRDARWPNFLRSIEVFTNETETQLNVLESERPVAKRFFDWCAEKVPGFVPGLLDYPAAGFTYRAATGSFFQVNRFLIDDLVRAAIGDAAGESALDLYAGVGLFSLPLAKRFSHVTSVESGATAVRDLHFNAGRASASIEIVHSATEDFLKNQKSAPDFVLADPPRTGLGKAVVARLAELKPRRIVIVSCDPATLARDLPGLLGAGYRIERLTMADLFPQTYHIETVAELTNVG